MPRITPAGVVVHARKAPANIAPPKALTRQLPNWLHGFKEYTDEAESPAAYLRWAGLSTIAGAAQRKIWMQTQYFSVHSNLFVVLVGPPGSKKSTAIAQSRKLLRQVPEIHFTTSATSVAALIQQFTAIAGREHQSLSAYISELASLLSLSKEEMVDFLTDIYDGQPDWDKQTRSSSKEKIPAPWLNLLAGTTPQWLGDNFTRTAVEGGFAARTLFVFDDTRILKSPWPEITEHHTQLEAALVNDLVHISTLSGEFKFSAEAREWYNDWYLDASRFPSVADNRTAGYYVRKPIHVLKVGMAISLAQRSDLVLTLDDLIVAVAMLDTIEPGMHAAFRAVGGNIFATDLERIESQIVGSSGLQYGAILAANFHAVDKFNLDRILDSLVAMGTVEAILVPGGQRIYKRRRGT